MTFLPGFVLRVWGAPIIPLVCRVFQADRFSWDFERLVGRISRDGWRWFSAGTESRGVARMYRFREKADGGRSMRFECSCAASLSDEGQLV